MGGIRVRMESCTDGYGYTIPGSGATAVPATSYLNSYYANPQYKANIIYGLATYRF